MASVTIMHGHKNLIFAALIANETGAKFREEGQWITIENSPALTIPRYAFDQAFDPEGRGDPRLERAWRALILNKTGYLKYFGDDEIYLVDEVDAPAD